MHTALITYTGRRLLWFALLLLTGCNPFGSGEIDPLFGAGSQVSRLWVHGPTTLNQSQCYGFELGNEATHPGIWPPPQAIAVEMAPGAALSVYETVEGCVENLSVDRITVAGGQTSTHFFLKSESEGSSHLEFFHPAYGEGSIAVFTAPPGFNSYATVSSSTGPASVHSIARPETSFYLGGQFNQYGSTALSSPVVKINSDGTIDLSFAPLEPFNTIFGITVLGTELLVAGEYEAQAKWALLSASGTTLHTQIFGAPGSRLTRAWKKDSTSLFVVGSLLSFPDPGVDMGLALIDSQTGTPSIVGAYTGPAHWPVLSALPLGGDHIVINQGTALALLNTGGEILAEYTATGETFGQLSPVPGQLTHFHCVVQRDGRSTVRTFAVVDAALVEQAGPLPSTALTQENSILGEISALAPLGPQSVLLGLSVSTSQAQVGILRFIPDPGYASIHLHPSIFGDNGRVVRIHTLTPTASSSSSEPAAGTPLHILVGGAFSQIDGQPQLNVGQITATYPSIE